MDAYASGDALSRRLQEVGLGTGSSASERVRAALSDTRNPTVRRILAEVDMAVGRLVADLFNIFDPHAVVLAGGLIEARPQALTAIRRHARLRTLVSDRMPQRLHRGQLGRLAGLHGAAVVASTTIERST